MFTARPRPDQPGASSDRHGEQMECHVAVLSVASDSDRPPLTVPVWYGYQPGGTLSFLTGAQGRKVWKTTLIQQAGAAVDPTRRPLAG